MDDMIKKFTEQAEKIYTDQDRDSLGMSDRKVNAQVLSECVVDAAGQWFRAMLSESVGLESEKVEEDGMLDMMFEDKDDAEYLYDFMVGNGLMTDGDIRYSDSVVSFSGKIIESKTPLIQAVLLAYEKQLDLEEDGDIDVLESVIGNLTDLIMEAQTPGAPKTGKDFNPYHGRKDGKFVNSKVHLSQKGGSWAQGKRKLKFTGKQKSKKGAAMARYGSTKHPCGRAARAKGKNIRCWDGRDMSGGAGQRVAKVMKGKKRRNEDFSIDELSLMLEVKNTYKDI